MYVYGPSGSGKTTLLVSLITDLYRTERNKPVWSRVFVISPTIHVDPAWHAVKRFATEELKTDLEEQPCFFDRWSDLTVSRILEEQREVVDKVKELKREGKFRGPMPQILIVVDDCLDDTHAMRHSHVMWELAARSRHAMTSFIVASQQVRGRTRSSDSNVTSWCVFAPRNEKEAEAIAEEHSALLGKKRTLEILREATSEPHSFLFINCESPHRFWRNFDSLQLSMKLNVGDSSARRRSRATRTLCPSARDSLRRWLLARREMVVAVATAGVVRAPVPR
jgi:hypothetical protein